MNRIAYLHQPFQLIYVPGVLISPKPDQEGNKLMFLSEWREFPSAPCMCSVYHRGADKS